MFIVVADAAMRRGPLSREVTLAASLMQLAVLIVLLTVVLLAMLSPNSFVVFGIHPASFILVIAVLSGFRIIQTSEIEPKWYTRRRSYFTTQQTNHDESDTDNVVLSKQLMGQYLASVALVGGAGLLISFSGQGLVEETGTSPMLMGMTGMAIASSLPELVTAVSAVRRGAVALAIGDIIGGNVFDTLILAIADFAYLDSSIYGGVSVDVPFLTGITILMSSVLLVMFVRREAEGLGAHIGSESYLILLIYVAGILFILF